jgi:translation initiation factor 1A
LAGRRGGGYHRKKQYGKRKIEATEGEPRIRMPKEGEVLGIVISTLGGSRMRVACKDGKERVCRIPGKLRNRIWVKENDVVIVRPWEIEGDTKGDIIWRYYPLQARILRDKGHI